MRLIFVRHGQTDHNAGNITLGRADVPLNDLGRQQAAALAASFAQPPAAIYTSPLARCTAIADAIASVFGTPAVVDEALVEMDIGEMEHLSSAELRERYPGFLREWMSDRVAAARMPGGETLAEVQARAWAAVERLAAAHPSGDIVAVSHNFVIRAIVCRALDLPLARFRRFNIGVASRTVIEMGERGPTLISVNDTSHLRAAGLE